MHLLGWSYHWFKLKVGTELASCGLAVGLTACFHRTPQIFFLLVDYVAATIGPLPGPFSYVVRAVFDILTPFFRLGA
jgi:hypothetical protein